MVGRVVVGRDASNHAFGRFDVALTYEMPRRLRSEEDEDGDGDGPRPLDGKGDLVSPFGGSAAERRHDSCRDELAKRPGEVDVDGKVSSQSCGTNLGSVGWCHGGENPPRDTAEDLADEEDRQTGCEEGNEDAAAHCSQRHHHDLAVAKLVGQISVQKGSDDGADACTVTESGLPCGTQTIATSGSVVVSKCFLESGLSEKRVDEDDVVAYLDQLGVLVGRRWQVYLP